MRLRISLFVLVAYTITLSYTTWVRIYWKLGFLFDSCWMSQMSRLYKCSLFWLFASLCIFWIQNRSASSLDCIMRELEKSTKGSMYLIKRFLQPTSSQKQSRIFETNQRSVAHSWCPYLSEIAVSMHLMNLGVTEACNNRRCSTVAKLLFRQDN